MSTRVNPTWLSELLDHSERFIEPLDHNCRRYCNCPPGFTGDLCERPVCATNPCNSGGTCLSSKTGPGFLCLCALGFKE